MNYLQDSEGNTITMPEDVELNRRVVNFLNFAIAGDFSSDFEVPNDSEVRKTLGYYSLNQVNKIIQKPFHFFVDGVKTSTGRVFIRGVSDTFDLFFIAGNGNWMNQITGSIKDLDFSDYDIPFDAPTINSQRTATDGIIFPLADWNTNYKRLSNAYLVKPISGISVDTIYDLYPCFHEHTILKRLFESYGIRLAGNLLDDNIFNSLIITPEQIKSAAYSSAITGVFQEMEGSEDDIVSPFPIGKLDMLSGTDYFDDANDRLTWPETAAGITFTFSYQRPSNGGTSGTLQLRKNGAAVSTVEFGLALTASGSIKLDMTAGDYVELWAFPAGTYTASVQASYPESVTANRVIVSNMLPEIQQMDFIKHIASRFTCLIEYSEETQVLTFTKLDYISAVDAVDFT